MRQFKVTQSITSRGEDSIGRYLSDISRIPMICAEEEHILAKKIKAGDQSAENRLITANLRFVVSCAKRYTRLGISLADLIAEGNLGLLKAAKTYDETKGFKFISYAVWWVRQAMLQSLNEHARTVRIPANQQNDMLDINAKAVELEQTLERQPTIEELAEALGKPAVQLSRCLVANARGTYLDDYFPGCESEESTLYQFLPHQDSNLMDEWIDQDMLRYGISCMISTLKERDQKILIFSYGLFGKPKMEPEDVADLLGVSSERVRQLKKQALQKLRTVPAIERLKEYA